VTRSFRIPETCYHHGRDICAQGGAVAAGEAGDGRSRGGVQSLDRAFAILEAMADAGGMIGLSQLASDSGLPLATIHRLVRTRRPAGR
jgi:hypothetical protein